MYFWGLSGDNPLFLLSIICVHLQHYFFSSITNLFTLEGYREIPLFFLCANFALTLKAKNMGNKFDFIAIDFETAMPARNSACSLGMAYVKDKEIVHTKYFLIQPPGNEYFFANTAKHHLTAEDTANAPTFDVVWNEIANDIENNILVCHNASFDIDVLNKTAAHYNITPNIQRSFCTFQLTGKQLKEACSDFCVDCCNHHHAEADAVMCAKLFIRLLEVGIDLYANVLPLSKQPKKKVLFEDKKISKQNLVPELEKVENKDTIFYNAKVVITGNFSIYERDDLAALLKSFGADINTAISKKTNIVCLGDKPGPSKVNKLNELLEQGCQIKIMTEQDVYSYLESLK